MSGGNSSQCAGWQGWHSWGRWLSKLCNTWNWPVDMRRSHFYTHHNLHLDMDQRDISVLNLMPKALSESALLSKAHNLNIRVLPDHHFSTITPPGKRLNWPSLYFLWNLCGCKIVQVFRFMMPRGAQNSWAAWWAHQTHSQAIISSLWHLRRPKPLSVPQVTIMDWSHSNCIFLRDWGNFVSTFTYYKCRWTTDCNFSKLHIYIIYCKFATVWAYQQHNQQKFLAK
jgi:hypothetical protein